MAGTDDAQDPPVPIPNTVVKLCGAEDTWLETARENRKAPAFSDKRPCGKGYSFPQGFFLFCALANAAMALPAPNCLTVWYTGYKSPKPRLMLLSMATLPKGGIGEWNMKNILGRCWSLEN